MKARAFIMAILLSLAWVPAWAQEGGEAEDPEEVRSLLEKVELSAEEAVSLLALPEALQRKILKALAGAPSTVEFTATEMARIQGLPEGLVARVLGGQRAEKEVVQGKGREKDEKTGEEKGKEGEEGKRGDGRGKEEGQKEGYPLQEVDTKLQPFGARMFAREAEPMALAPTTPVPADYVLGPGDVLLIHYWNALVDATFTPEISSEGRITVPKGGELTIGGLTMEAGSKLLESRIRELFRDASVTVTLHSLRSIRVFVAGEVNSPGLHVLPALSTVLHALFVAGGPSERGSYRRIRVVRGEKNVAEVDLYEFFRQGLRKGDIRLQAGDTVFVPLARARVTVAGKVNRPAVYELLTEKDLGAVLELAGGIEPGGFKGSIRLERREGGRLVLIDVKGDPPSTEVRDGDTVKVFPVFPDPIEMVEISGAVERPGRYQWASSMKVSALLARAGRLLPDAHTGYAEIRRRTPPGAGGALASGGRIFHPEWMLVRVDLEKVLAGDPEADILLTRLDRLHILSL
ncbi:MAG: SLBB domain-containing protein, partial [Planctomycetota bacterium]